QTAVLARRQVAKAAHAAQALMKERLMEHTLYLSKSLGIGLVLIGLVIMVRHRYFIPIFATYAENRLVRAVASMIELFAGIFLVVAHNVWSPLPAAIVSIIGWMALLEGLLYLL